MKCHNLKKRYEIWIVTYNKYRILKKCPFQFSFHLEIILEELYQRKYNELSEHQKSQLNAPRYSKSIWV